MVDRLRRAIAAWLDPETAKEARRHWYLRMRLSEARDWLGHEFPLADAVVYYALVADRNHFRGLDEAASEAVPGKPWIHEIPEFREHLRRTYGARALAEEPR